MLWEALVAIHRSSLCWLEWNVTFLSTVCAGCLVHFSGTAKGTSAILTTATAPVIVSVVHEINSNNKMSSEIIEICMVSIPDAKPQGRPKYKNIGDSTLKQYNSPPDTPIFGPHFFRKSWGSGAGENAYPARCQNPVVNLTRPFPAPNVQPVISRPRPAHTPPAAKRIFVQYQPITCNRGIRKKGRQHLHGKTGTPFPVPDATTRYKRLKQ